MSVHACSWPSPTFVDARPEAKQDSVMSRALECPEPGKTKNVLHCALWGRVLIKWILSFPTWDDWTSAQTAQPCCLRAYLLLGFACCLEFTYCLSVRRKLKMCIDASGWHTACQGCRWPSIYCASNICWSRIAVLRHLDWYNSDWFWWKPWDVLGVMWNL